MPDYTIGSTEFLPLSDDTPRDEAAKMLKWAGRIPVKFVLIETRKKALRLLIFDVHEIFEHADIVRMNLNEQEGETFFGAGKIYHLQSLNTG